MSDCHIQEHNCKLANQHFCNKIVSQIGSEHKPPVTGPTARDSRSHPAPRPQKENGFTGIIKYDKKAKKMLTRVGFEPTPVKTAEDV